MTAGAERLTEHPRRPPGTVLAMPRELGAGVAEHLSLVDGLLHEVLSDLGHLWTAQLEPPGLDPAAGVDILADADLPHLLSSLSGSGGKRIRPVMSYLGWTAAHGRARDIGHAAVVQVGAALELLHLFALIHDDVMDESPWRRGLPTAHAEARLRHQAAGGRGDPQRFGESIAILLGDLAHAEADHLVGELPEPMRRIWRVLVVELVCGQRRDLTGSAARRHDLAHARQVARSKSGAYTVERPLELGAAAAGAPDVVAAGLAAYGRHLGEAFALRDDLLGVWGDPAKTGKPIGDDLSAGKPTVLTALAYERLSGGDLELLRRVAGGAGEPTDVTDLLAVLEAAGVRLEVEALISSHVQAALDALDQRVLDPAGLAQLRLVAHQIAWRDR